MKINKIHIKLVLMLHKFVVFYKLAGYQSYSAFIVMIILMNAINIIKQVMHFRSQPSQMLFTVDLI